MRKRKIIIMLYNWHYLPKCKTSQHVLLTSGHILFNFSSDSTSSGVTPTGFYRFLGWGFSTNMSPLRGWFFSRFKILVFNENFHYRAFCKPLYNINFHIINFPILRSFSGYCNKANKFIGIKKLPVTSNFH